MKQVTTTKERYNKNEAIRLVELSVSSMEEFFGQHFVSPSLPSLSQNSTCHIAVFFKLKYCEYFLKISTAHG